MDLERISTFGFRGEALASIAAVAKVEITTATADATAGTRVVLDAGRVVSVERAARPRGTTIEVDRALHNTPARRKFMKTPATESRLLVRLAGHVFLAAQGAGLRVIREGRAALVLDAQAGFRERLAALFGEDDRAAAWRRSTARATGSGSSGLAALADFARTRGERQILLVNGRAVADASLAHAVLAGIGGAIPSGRFPIFAIALTIDPSRIDVNVHPTKREIRFAERDRVYGAIRESVARARRRRALRCRRARPRSARTGERDRPSPAAAIRFGLPDDVPPATGLGREPKPVRRSESLRFAPAALEDPMPETDTGDTDTSAAEADALETGTGPLRLLGEAWGAYLLVEDRERILVIDQHAAHERVLYDEILARAKERAPLAAQGLLVPLPVDLGPGQDPAEACELLHTLGFEAREGGPATVFVEAIPGSLTALGRRRFPSRVLRVAGCRARQCRVVPGRAREVLLLPHAP